MEEYLESRSLGDFKWEEHLEYYYLKYRLDPPRDVEFCLFVEDEFTLALRNAEAFVENWAEWKPRIESELTGELRELYSHGGWRDDSSPVLDSQAFLAELDLRSIHFHEDGWIQLYYHPDDHEMFLGHIVEVQINSAGELDASIAG